MQGHQKYCNKIGGIRGFAADVEEAWITFYHGVLVRERLYRWIERMSGIPRVSSPTNHAGNVVKYSLSLSLSPRPPTFDIAAIYLLVPLIKSNRKWRRRGPPQLFFPPPFQESSPIFLPRSKICAREKSSSWRGGSIVDSNFSSTTAMQSRFRMHQRSTSFWKTVERVVSETRYKCTSFSRMYEIFVPFFFFSRVRRSFFLFLIKVHWNSVYNSIVKSVASSVTIIVRLLFRHKNVSVLKLNRYIFLFIVHNQLLTPYLSNLSRNYFLQPPSETSICSGNASLLRGKERNRLTICQRFFVIFVIYATISRCCFRLE